MDPSSMDGAYGKSRGELLSWLNATLPVDLQQHTGDIAKVEQCGSGIPYVFLLPRLFPNSASAQAAPGKVKFPARQEYEAASNLKLVQEVFSKNQISRNMDIDKMSKRNFQANLEFLQWFKRLCDNHNVGCDGDDHLPSGDGGGGATEQPLRQQGGQSHQTVVSGSSSTASGRPTMMVRRLGGNGASPSTSSPGSRKPSTGAGSTVSNNNTGTGGGGGGGAVRSLFGASSRPTTAIPASGSSPGAAVSSSRPLSAVSSLRDASTSSSSINRGGAGGVTRTGAPAGVVRSIISPTRRSKSPIGPVVPSSSGRSTSATRSLTPGASRPVYGSTGGARGFTPPPGTSSAMGSSGRASVGSMDPVGYVELERRYFFDKLRRIEELVRLPASEGIELALMVQKLLYAAH